MARRHALNWLRRCHIVVSNQKLLFFQKIGAFLFNLHRWSLIYFKNLVASTESSQLHNHFQRLILLLDTHIHSFRRFFRHAWLLANSLNFWRMCDNKGRNEQHIAGACLKKWRALQPFRELVQKFANFMSDRGHEDIFMLIWIMS